MFSLAEFRISSSLLTRADPTLDSVLASAKAAGANITHLLTTHHHPDHAEGNEAMAAAIPGLVVLGSDDRIPAMTKQVGDQDEISVGSLKIKALFTPCHTSGHLLYYVTDSAKPEQPAALFSGDTLFVAGCGRFFEGTGEQMNHALNVVIANLPHTTQVYVGHEYTVSNLRFAQHCEPENAHVNEQLSKAKASRERGEFTVPSTVAAELTFNPFMRLHSIELRKTLGLGESASEAEVMTALREAKNNFK